MRERLSFTEYSSRYNRPLILDGAVGSNLHNISKSSLLWSSLVNLESPNEVINLHKQYIESGADIITTNTFRTNPAALVKSNLELDNFHFVKDSVALAIEAVENKNVMIAGSNAPAEDCYQKQRTLSIQELKDNHEKHISYLWESGVDFILNETFSHIDEIEICARFCSQCKIPYMMSFYIDNDLKLLSGQDLNESIDFVHKYNPLAIGINCIRPDVISQLDLSQFKDVKWGFYFNCGAGEITDLEITCGISPKHYAESIKSYLKYNPSFVGSCCGSSPAHTKELKELLDELY